MIPFVAKREPVVTLHTTPLDQLNAKISTLLAPPKALVDPALRLVVSATSRSARPLVSAAWTDSFGETPLGHASNAAVERILDVCRSALAHSPSGLDDGMRARFARFVQTAANAELADSIARFLNRVVTHGDKRTVGLFVAEIAVPIDLRSGVLIH